MLGLDDKRATSLMRTRIEIIGESYRDKHRLDPDRPKPSKTRVRRKKS